MIEIGGMAVASEQESCAIDVWVCCQNLQGARLTVSTEKWHHWKLGSLGGETHPRWDHNKYHNKVQKHHQLKMGVWLSW